jgi:hypothetical protein
MPPKIKDELETREAATKRFLEEKDETIKTLKEQLEAEKKEASRVHDARRRAKEERDEVEKKYMELQAKQADNNAMLSRLERDLSLGATSPMDWDRGKKGDLVERITNAFKTRSVTDASLRAAHETLMRTHQALAIQFEASRVGYTTVLDVLEQHGLPKGSATPEIASFLRKFFVERSSPAPGEDYHAHVSAPEKGDIHIHLHIV